MTGTVALVANVRPFVPSIGLNTGLPSYATVKCVSEILTAAVCGIALAIAASRAWGVPGMESSTLALGPSAGIFRKSGGNCLPGTKAHGPSVESDANHRPEINT